MNLTYEQRVIIDILRHYSDWGKTAVMKIIYMLQQIKKLPLKYDFSIYTYGPYSADVTEDVNYLIGKQIISADSYFFNTNSGSGVGYHLNLSAQVKKEDSILSPKEAKDVDSIVEFARDKTAKELELYSTIIYVDRSNILNQWGKNNSELQKTVNEIKPHFSIEEIGEAFRTLQQIKYISN